MSILKMADRLLRLGNEVRCYCREQLVMHTPGAPRCEASMYHQANGPIDDGQTVAKHYLRAVELLKKHANLNINLRPEVKCYANEVEEFLKEAEGERGE